MDGDRPGLLFMIHPRGARGHPVLLFDMETGKLVDQLIIGMNGNNKLDIIEPFGRCLLLKRTYCDFEFFSVRPVLSRPLGGYSQAQCD